MDDQDIEVTAPAGAHVDYALVAEVETLRQELQRFKGMSATLAMALRPFGNLGRVLESVAQPEGRMTVQLYDGTEELEEAVEPVFDLAHPVDPEGFLLSLKGRPKGSSGTIVAPAIRTRHFSAAHAAMQEAMESTHIVQELNKKGRL